MCERIRKALRRFWELAGGFQESELQPGPHDWTTAPDEVIVFTPRDPQPAAL